LEALLAAGAAAPPAPGRDWHLELLAERAIDVGRLRRLDEANALVDQVVRGAEATHQIALGRAMLASGQALAWIGTDEATRQSHRAFADAAAMFVLLGHREWHGSALLRRGYSASYQYGDLVGAEALIGQALLTYEPDSPRLAGALLPYADVLIDLGQFDRAEEAIDRAAALAERDGMEKALNEAIWARARVAAGRDDARACERLLREAERGATTLDWFETHIGLSFLLEGAELLDQVGLSEQALAYFERARERAGDANEEVLQTKAVLSARSGDPVQALEDLQEVVRGDWLEKRVLWRHELLTAWATFRAGRSGAGELAARALRQANDGGTVHIAVAGEPRIVAAMAPVAERVGSGLARELLLAGRPLLVRLFGPVGVRTPDGEEITLPAGMPGELVRLLALHEHGLPVEAVLETFFPDVSPPVARQRLRQVLTRLRSASGELIARDGDTLRLLPAWVDVREFLAATSRVRGARGPRAVQLAYGALALHDGPLLPCHPYAGWADETRADVSYRYLAMLDLVAADAAARGAHQEALTALEATLKQDPDRDDAQAAAGEHLRALGRHRSAGHVARGDRTRHPQP
ncbi:MAG: BTAD domain-containing putative transcriptional regulator, partial [Solirubrobacteraceae bacterium]